jgi:hypothetical protein
MKAKMEQFMYKRFFLYTELCFPVSLTPVSLNPEPYSS